MLQNENGPCPLLAAANALLLKKDISLPLSAIRAGVASIDDVVNVLAERALVSSTSTAKHHDSHSTSHYYLDDLMQAFPKLQYGMDVNPKFTQGVNGVEYTSALTAFDLLNVELVHGWLLDPQDDATFQLVQQKTYNELVEIVVQGNEASEQVQGIGGEIEEVEKELAGLDKQDDEEWVNVKSDNGGGDASGGNGKGGTSDETAAAPPLPPVPEPDAAAPPSASGTTADPSDEKDKGTNEDSASAKETTEETTVEDGSKASSEEAVMVQKDEGEAPADDKEKTDHVANETEAPSNDDETEETSPSEAKESSTSPQASDDTPSGSTMSKPALSLEERKQELETKLSELKQEREKLSTVATNASLINSFLSSTGHQLTHYGLHELYLALEEESLCVFFRNNHFATLTKHKGVLYLLVTDLGYANVPNIVWEKIDGIDGDTEYVDSYFSKPAPQAELKPAPGPSLNPQEVLAQRGQVDADMQLALQLSKHDVNNSESNTTTNMAEEEGKLVAAATEASLRTFNGIEEDTTTSAGETNEGTVASIPPPSNNTNGLVDGCSTQEDSDALIAMQLQHRLNNEDASMHLAQQLQEEERLQEEARRKKNNNTTTGRRKTNQVGSGGKSTATNCVIS